MSSDNISRMSASAIADSVNKKELKAEDVAQAFLARIKKDDPKINAFVTVMEKEAIEAARAVDKKIAQGQPGGRLAGVPVAIKDNIQIQGVQTTCSSNILKGYRAAYDATVIGRMRKEGAVFLGKTNLDEFAMGSSTENSAFFKTKNPWDLERVPGGSSGGSAAAVAARFAPLGFGSDTGGSIRQPAALCGIVGLKPTYGLVSRYGLVAFASSLDQIGPFSRSVADAALALSVIAGKDPRDSTSSAEPGKDYLSNLDSFSLKGLRIGVPKEYFIDGLDSQILKSVTETLGVLCSLGAERVDVSLPHTKYAVSTYYIIAPAEASANLARFDGIRYGHSTLRKQKDLSLLEVYEQSRGGGFGPEVKRRIMLGTFALNSGYYDAYYGKAQRVRTLIQRDFTDAFKQADVLLTPTTPSAAFKFGEKAADPLQMYLSDIFTIPCNLAGIPGLSIPCGLTDQRLPIGVQLLGKAFNDAKLLAIARAIEKAKPFPVLEDGSLAC